TKTGQIVMGAHRCHKLNTAARCCKWQWPQRIGPSQPDDLIQLRREKTRPFHARRRWRQFNNTHAYSGLTSKKTHLYLDIDESQNYNILTAYRANCII